MLLNKTTGIPGLKIIFKGLQTQQPFEKIFLLGQVLFLTRHIMGEKRLTNPCVIFYLRT